MKKPRGFVCAAAVGCGASAGNAAAGIEPIAHVEIVPDPDTMVRRPSGAKISEEAKPSRAGGRG